MRIEDKEFKMENCGFIKVLVRGWRIWNSKLRGEGCGLRIGNHDLRIYHATPTFDIHISGQLLLQIMLFWGHCKVLNLSLEGNLQLFPGLQFFMINKLNLKQLCEQTINISVRNFVCVVIVLFYRYLFEMALVFEFFLLYNERLYWLRCSSSFCGYYSGTFCCGEPKFKILQSLNIETFLKLLYQSYYPLEII